MTAAEKQKHKSGKGNINSFVFFLILATLFWVLTKFSKQYEQDVQAQLEYINIPANAVISEDGISTVPLRLSASGFEFLYYKLSKPKITIDLTRLEPDNNTRWMISKQGLENLATLQLKHSVDLLSERSNLELPIRSLGQKRVPVLANIAYTFKEGYSYVKPLRITPDSVTVIGPENSLAQVNALETVAASFDGVDEAISGSLELLLPDTVDKLKLDPSQVEYSMEVQEFIENELSVPITLIGSDEVRGIQLFPSSVTVRYTINFSDYKKVQAGDFKVICDLSKVEEGANFLIPELIEAPAGARRLSLSPTQVEFIAIQ
ncbi:CdaR family protein [Gilvibacter sediminis]|uniref:CdaR family protein n=1 Tax=Gilvibacter sediminis TaxID=379071 RepID=UPI002350728E|nr:YbbR-like domain-containing protein [Gilvibacter sediminis]MDC7997851.1 CdaR family protein [Gilvibacter sediminis]